MVFWWAGMIHYYYVVVVVVRRGARMSGFVGAVLGVFFGFYAHMSKTDRFYDRNRSYKIRPVFR